MSQIPSDINEPLTCTTPRSWLAAARKNLDLLLLDHANCEKKAAATAVSLIFEYGDRYPQIQEVLSRLAREELRHFELVLRLLQKRGIPARPLGASRYAGGLRRHVRRNEPERLVDLLLIGALIEVRSCERFRALVPELDQELSEFYSGLAVAESRHYGVYLKLARQIGGDAHTDRLRYFANIESALITDKDRNFRFHSGPPQ